MNINNKPVEGQTVYGFFLIFFLKIKSFGGSTIFFDRFASFDCGCTIGGTIFSGFLRAYCHARTTVIVVQHSFSEKK